MRGPARAALAVALLLAAAACASSGGPGAGAPGQGEPGVPVALALELAEPVELTDADVLVAPVKIEAPAPPYPEELRRARIQGVVVLRCLIGRDGSVTVLEVLRSDHPGLAQVARSTTARYRLAPATLNGKPVAVYFNFTHTFRLTQ